MPVEVAAGVAAGRVLRLPFPVSPPPGPLEGVAWVLLHRVAPFDPAVQVRLAAGWGLAVPRWLGERAGSVAAAGGRALGASRRLSRLCAGCLPPLVLLEAVRLLGQLPGLPHEGVRAALLLSDLSRGEAGAALVRGLAGLWGLEVTGTAVWPAPQEQGALVELGRLVRRRGALTASRVLSAGEVDWLAGHAGVDCSQGYLLAVGDSRSALSRSVRRQLAAVGPLPAAVLARGAGRVRRDLVGESEQAVLAWAGGQRDLRVNGATVAPTGDARRWLLPSDRAVLGLMAWTCRASSNSLPGG